MTSLDSVGVIGVGNMGAGIIDHLVSAGFDVSAFDVDETARDRAGELGATVRESAAELGRSVELALVVVPAEVHVRAVCTGDDNLFEDFGDGYVAINSSVSPSLPEEIQDLAPPNVEVLDAPMCRGAIAAKEGNILFLLGGPEDAIERCRPAFEACGETIRLGPLGAGQIGKTANNVLNYIAVLGDYEILQLAKQSDVDIDPTNLREMLPHSSGDNWPVRKGNWENLRLTWPVKDYDIALEYADERGVSLPMCGLASELIKDLEVSDLEEFYFEEYR